MTLADLLAGVIFIALNAYALLGGADFGGGVWALLASGPRKQRQRELIAHAIGPVWEANHVWLILAVVLLFTCFPPAFARLGTLLHIPLSLVLIGIVLRGSAFTFWRYGGAEDEELRHWGVTFAIASLITPLLLGITVGAIASGAVFGARDPDTAFVAVYVAPWLNPFTLSVGLFALVAFGFLAAVYLTLEAQVRELGHPAARAHRRRGDHGARGTGTRRVAGRAHRRRDSGFAHSVGLGAGAVSLPHPARSGHRGRRRARRDAAARVGRAGTRRGGPAAVARLSLSRVQAGSSSACMSAAAVIARTGVTARRWPAGPVSAPRARARRRAGSSRAHPPRRGGASGGSARPPNR